MLLLPLTPLISKVRMCRLDNVSEYSHRCEKELDGSACERYSFRLKFAFWLIKILFASISLASCKKSHAEHFL